MKKRIAINGFGRIGRSAFKIAFERSDLEVVAINEPGGVDAAKYLLKHDSNYGAYHHDVDVVDGNLVVDGKTIRVLKEFEPEKLPWGEMKVDVVIESTGVFTHLEGAERHLKAGAKRVVLSGPAKGEGIDTVVIGVNDEKVKTATHVVSNASCTTNSLGAVMSVLENEFGVVKSMLTTVHSYTASQRLQDAPAKDPREGRNAAENIVPTSTGAAKALAKVMPSLEGKFDGISMRVPTPVVSISDVTSLLGKKVTADEVNAVLTKASKDPYYQGVLGVSTEPLVSCDYLGNSHSGVVDLALTRVVDGDLVKVCVWYDNEWGYSNRLVELVSDVAKEV